MLMAGVEGRWRLKEVGFLILLLFSSSLGLLPSSALPSTPAAAQPYIPSQSDKALHFICFFLLTVVFYFIFDTARRRVIHLTLIICTLLLGVGSEVAQGLLPNDREFDAWDVLANVLGSLAALGLASAYHRRSAERRRRAKYSALTGDGLEGEDLELGERANGAMRAGDDGQETGVVPARTIEEELDNWDENAPDDAWDDDDDTTATQNTKVTPSTSSVGSEEPPHKVAVD
ncbi:VanZ domain protein [Cladophialophora carrionii]|uniref:VanZ domain protein n=1 Tax=Cladophialophora carrionii TaxID=86049 RepID=A0A1C1CDN4_9EURO|nr:VanZ domain protein [Cladophialophora carrionii]